MPPCSQTLGLARFSFLTPVLAVMIVSILSVHCVVYVVYQFVWLRVVGGSGHYILCVFLIMSQSCDHYIITVKRLSRMWLEILKA